MANEKEFSKEERIAYSQGALNTLLGERNELLKLVQITENLINVHVEELKKLGVKFESAKEK